MPNWCQNKVILEAVADESQLESIKSLLFRSMNDISDDETEQANPSPQDWDEALVLDFSKATPMPDHLQFPDQTSRNLNSEQQNLAVSASDPVAGFTPFWLLASQTRIEPKRLSATDERRRIGDFGKGA